MSGEAPPRGTGRQRRWATSVTVAVAVTAAVLLLSGAGSFDGLDRLVLDNRMRAEDLRRVRAGTTDQQVVILTINPQQLADLRAGERSGRPKLAAAVRAISRHSPSAVVLHFALDTHGIGDQELAAAFRAAGNVVLRAQLESPRPTQFGLTRPLRLLRDSAAGYGFLYWLADRDGVVRQFLLALPGVTEVSLPVAAWATAKRLPVEEVRAYLQRHTALPKRGPVSGDLRLRLRFRGPPRAGFRTIELDQYLATPFDLAGRVVVIGTLDHTFGGSTVPLSQSWRPEYRERWPEPMNGVELTANAISTLLRGDEIRPLAPLPLTVALLALALLVSWVAAGPSTRRTALTALLAAVGWSWSSRLAYRHWSVDVPLAQAWLTALGCLVVGCYRRVHTDMVRHRLEAAESRAERERLAELVAAKRAVIGTVVHDLKVPLAIIKGQALTLLSDPDGHLGRAVHEEFLGTIAAQCDRLTAMTEDILDTDPQRVLTVRREPTDLLVLVRLAVEMHETTAAHHEFQIQAGELPPVPVDRDKMQRVLNNLVSNAVKYSPEGGEVVVRLFRRGAEEAVIEVADSGIGMTAAQQARLFGLFVRVLDRPDEIPGTGVGLYSSRRLVEAHDGTIEVSSEPGHGSVFRVVLPLAAAARQAAD